MVPKHLGTNPQMPNSYPNDFGKFRRFRRIQLLRKHFINKNMTRRVRKRGAYGYLNTSESHQIGRESP